jgi:hypothetical protein
MKRHVLSLLILLGFIVGAASLACHAPAYGPTLLLAVFGLSALALSALSLLWRQS